MPTISYSIGGEQHDITGLSGEEVMDMIKMNYIAEAEAEAEEKTTTMSNNTEIANVAYTSPYMRGEIEEAEAEPIKKEIDLNFAINVYDEVKYNEDKLDELLHSAWLIDLETDIEDLIQERIKMKLNADKSYDTFDGDVVINDTGY